MGWTRGHLGDADPCTSWAGGTGIPLGRMGLPSPVPLGAAVGVTSPWHCHLLLSRAVPSLFPDKGSIHKVVELPDGVQNIMEIQVFPDKDPIQSMILDHARVGPCSGGQENWVGQAAPGVWG